MMEFSNFENETPIPGLSVTATGGELPGRRRLEPETAISLDLGYRDNPTDALSLEANFFWTRGANLIQLSSVDFAPLAEISPTHNGRSMWAAAASSTTLRPPTSTVANSAPAGLPSTVWTSSANYTLTLTEHSSSALLGGNLGGGEVRRADQRTPMHKFNLGVQARFPFGLDVEIFGHYVSKQVWLEQVFDTTRGVGYESFTLPEYFQLNARVGYRAFGDKLELSLTGTISRMFSQARAIANILSATPSRCESWPRRVIVSRSRPRAPCKQVPLRVL